MWKQSDGYTKVRLGRDANGRAVDERAHAIMCGIRNGFQSVAGSGPATRGSSSAAQAAEQQWVARHTCHDEKCLNPCHLIWGFPKHNRADQEIKKAARGGGKRPRESLGECSASQPQPLRQRLSYG